jgi:CRP/FNR family transcriptional regulator
MELHLAHGRRRLRVGERIYLFGEPFENLFLITSGLCKVVSQTSDGREQPTGPYFKGDWLGFDGIPTGNHGCSAVALDIGEVWTFRYDALLRVAAVEPLVMRLLLSAMTSQLARNRDAMLSVNTLAADGRVADFLLRWAQSLAERGLRTDQIHLHMTRADMGSHTGLTLETVCRALARLARCGVIQFNEKGRRDISIPDLAALRDFVQSRTDPITLLLH